VIKFSNLVKCKECKCVVAVVQIAKEFRELKHPWGGDWGVMWSQLILLWEECMLSGWNNEASIDNL
jgi:hypothetical protein